MSLDNFFRINLPYGIKKNGNNEWFAFNREYMPLGWNSTSHKLNIYDKNVYSEFPIYTHYKNITEAQLKQIAVDSESFKFDENGKINLVFFYDDRSNPSVHFEKWDIYFQKIKILSTFQTT